MAKLDAEWRRIGGLLAGPSAAMTAFLTLEWTDPIPIDFWGLGVGRPDGSSESSSGHLCDEVPIRLMESDGMAYFYVLTDLPWAASCFHLVRSLLPHKHFWSSLLCTFDLLPSVRDSLRTVFRPCC